MSLSEGYNTPALAAGPLLVSLMVGARLRLSSGVSSSPRGMLVLAVCLTLAVWGLGRTWYVYRDMPAEYLGKTLGEERAVPNELSFH